ncbi:MAG: formylglycine-generating enzyme family protein [Rhodospirillaceae bacterium]|nr:formylglycine-generating enzyme family protein [Rhodospirillaceae bacterium]
MPVSRALAVALCLMLAAPALAQPKTVKDCADCPEMVLVPPGEFLMGSDKAWKETDMMRGEAPQVKVTIGRAFYLGKTEVTHGMFAAFVKDTGYQVKLGCRVWDNEFVDKPDATWQNPYQPRNPQPNHPVGCVSWTDAQAFIAWLSKKAGKTYRLPTESEWEYAARAGTTTSRFWGDNPDDACDWANTFDISSKEKYPLPFTHAACKDGHADLAPVGSFKPNAFGLHDMIGNVWEWVQDCYAGSHQGRPKDGRAWEWEPGCEMRGTRGGAWMSAPERNRIAWPGRDPEERHMGYFGFRVARDAE